MNVRVRKCSSKLALNLSSSHSWWLLASARLPLRLSPMWWINMLFQNNCATNSFQIQTPNRPSSCEIFVRRDFNVSRKKIHLAKDEWDQLLNTKISLVSAIDVGTTPARGSKVCWLKYGSVWAWLCWCTPKDLCVGRQHDWASDITKSCPCQEKPTW